MVPPLEDALAQVGAPLTVELAPYGQVVEQLLSQGSAFARNATWELPSLLSELAGRQVDLAAVRDEFRALLLAHQPPQR